MAKFVKIPVNESESQLQFMCPACKITHAINSAWKFNGDFDCPTTDPSILVDGHKFDENGNGVPFRCHSWITGGKIKFFEDCTHEMARQEWVELPEIEN